MGNAHSNEKKHTHTFGDLTPNDSNESERNTKDDLPAKKAIPIAKKAAHTMNPRDYVLNKSVQKHGMYNKNAKGIIGMELDVPVVGSPLLDHRAGSIPIRGNRMERPGASSYNRDSFGIDQQLELGKRQYFMPETIPETLPRDTQMELFAEHEVNGPKISELKINDTVMDEDILVPTLIKWEDPAEVVYVAGSFNEWKYKIKMTKNESLWSIVINLPVGMHCLKFVVDGEWRYSRNLVTAPDNSGNLVNYIKVEDVIINVGEDEANDVNVEGISSDLMSGSPPGDYGRVIPNLVAMDRMKGSGAKKVPPALPPHLNQVLLNSTEISKDDPSVLPIPNTVVLNHLYACSIKDNVMAVSSTSRYRKKYLTTIYYKPVS